MAGISDSRRRLADLMEQRRLELGLRWKEVAEAGGISYEAIRAIRSGDASIRPLTRHGIEVGLRWEPGSVERILDGGDPAPIAIPAPRPAPARELPANFPVFTDKMEEASDPYVDNVRDLVELARRRYPDGPLTGKQVFPLDPRGQLYWDSAAGIGWRQEEGTIKITAALLATIDAEEAAARENGSETGLVRGHSRHTRRKHVVTMRA